MQTKRIFNGYTVAKLAAGLALMAFSVHAADEAVPAAEATDTAAAAVTPAEAAPAPADPATPAVTTPPVKAPAATDLTAKPVAETPKKAEGLEAEAHPYKTQRDPIRQLGRGLANMVTGVFEIPVNIHNVNKADGGVAALSYGLFRGVWRFLVRETVGVFEFITFPVGWAPVIEPEFLFSEDQYTDWEVSHLHFAGEE